MTSQQNFLCLHSLLPTELKNLYLQQTQGWVLFFFPPSAHICWKQQVYTSTRMKNQRNLYNHNVHEMKSVTGLHFVHAVSRLITISGADVKASTHSKPVISTLINVSSTDRQDEQRGLKITDISQSQTHTHKQSLWWYPRVYLHNVYVWVRDTEVL